MAIGAQTARTTALTLLLGLWATVFAIAAEPLKGLDRPVDRTFVVDLAKLLTKDDSAKIKAVAGKLLEEKATPIIVVTIESMAKHGGGGIAIEGFATRLFDQWEIGQAKLNGQDWNTGILLLVSKKDRKMRIELGRGWAHKEDEYCQKVVDEQILPRFKEGDFSGGILAGANALEAMARGLELPKPKPSQN